MDRANELIKRLKLRGYKILKTDKFVYLSNKYTNDIIDFNLEDEDIHIINDQYIKVDILSWFCELCLLINKEL